MIVQQAFGQQLNDPYKLQKLGIRESKVEGFKSSELYFGERLEKLINIALEGVDLDNPHSME